MFTGLVALLFLVLLIPGLFGWIIPLVFGIKHIRKKTGGVVLTVVGSVWGAFAIVFGGLFTFFLVMGLRTMQVEDFDPAKFQGKTGRILLSHKAESELVVMSMGGIGTKRLRFKTLDGVITAPEGKYFPFEYTAFARDPAGKKWKASCTLLGGSVDDVSVSAESPRELAVGPPFTAKVTVTKEPGGEVGIDLKLTGQGGGRYTIQQMDSNDTPPGFEIIGPDGKVVLKDKFHFG
ncbi:MAG: hypothetical protein HZA88_05465 [Verrucomicrobia bacterium]|nr:hypothetical protein [Verrucomicrobiota bacterium]